MEKEKNHQKKTEKHTEGGIFTEKNPMIFKLLEATDI